MARYRPAPEGPHAIIPGRSVIVGDDLCYYRVIAVAEDGMSGKAEAIPSGTLIGFKVTSRAVEATLLRVRAAEFDKDGLLPDLMFEGFGGRVGIITVRGSK